MKHLLFALAVLAVFSNALGCGADDDSAGASEKPGASAGGAGKGTAQQHGGAGATDDRAGGGKAGTGSVVASCDGEFDFGPELSGGGMKGTPTGGDLVTGRYVMTAHIRTAVKPGSSCSLGIAETGVLHVASVTGDHSVMEFFSQYVYLNNPRTEYRPHYIIDATTHGNTMTWSYKPCPGGGARDDEEIPYLATDASIETFGELDGCEDYYKYVLDSAMAPSGGATQQAYLKADNAESDDQFGTTVAISGDVIAIGAPGEDSSGTGVNTADNNGVKDSGAVYVFAPGNNGGWTQEARIKSMVVGDRAFGQMLAASGDTIAVGGGGGNRGTIQVYRRSPTGTWSAEAQLRPEDAGVTSCCSSLALSGDTLAVTANDNQAVVSVHVFERKGTQWTQTASIEAPSMDAWFNQNLVLSNDTLVVSYNPVNGDGTELGAYVFTKSGADWIKEADLDGASGSFLRFALAGDLLAKVGDARMSGNDVEILGRADGLWSTIATLGPDSTPLELATRFGSGLALSSDTLLVGGSRQYSDAGKTMTQPAIYIFHGDGSTWTAAGSVMPDEVGPYTGRNKSLGQSIAIDGKTFVAGDPGDSTDASGSGSVDLDQKSFGAAYVFKLD